MFPGDEDLYRETVYERDDNARTFKIIQSFVSDKYTVNPKE